MAFERLSILIPLSLQIAVASKGHVDPLIAWKSRDLMMTERQSRVIGAEKVPILTASIESACFGSGERLCQRKYEYGQEGETKNYKRLL